MEILLAGGGEGGGLKIQKTDNWIEAAGKFVEQAEFVISGEADIGLATEDWRERAYLRR